MNILLRQSSLSKGAWHGDPRRHANAVARLESVIARGHLIRGTYFSTEFDDQHDGPRKPCCAVMALTGGRYSQYGAIMQRRYGWPAAFTEKFIRAYDRSGDHIGFVRKALALMPPGTDLKVVTARLGDEPEAVELLDVLRAQAIAPRALAAATPSRRWSLPSWLAPAQPAFATLAVALAVVSLLPLPS